MASGAAGVSAPQAVPIADAPAEALRLLGELSDELARDAGDAARAGVAPLAEAVRHSDLPGLLWIGPGDEAVGLAWWEPPSEVGRRAGLYLARGYRTEAALGGLVNAVDAAGPGPLVEVADRLPGVPPATRTAVLSARGFVPVSRIDLAWPAGRTAPPAPAPAAGVVRRLGRADAEALAVLLDRAYADNPVDRALFLQRTDRREDAREAIRLLVSGGLGPWMDAASFGVDLDGRLVAATLANDFHGALLTEVMVDPDVRRRGLGRTVVLRSVAALQAAGRSDIRLVVTVSNEPAYRLYTSLGFVPQPTSEGATWLHAARMGLGPAPG
jgi:ribosomal protein S18 acetylase RimI-like enzyme